jgi:hypothetical protein
LQVIFLLGNPEWLNKYLQDYNIAFQSIGQ